MMEEVKRQRKVGVRYLKACEIIDMNQKIGLDKGLNKGARGIISVSRKYRASDSEILEELSNQLGFSLREAKSALESYDAENTDLPV